MRFTPHGLLGRRFWLLFSASSLASVSTGAITPILPQLIQNELGHSATAVGMVVGAGSVLTVVANPLLGQFADRFGRRTTAMVGTIVTAVSLLALVVTGSLFGVGAGRAFFGLGVIAINVALTAWVVDATRDDDRGRALGMFGTSVWVGLALGPQIGQILLHNIGFHAVWLACAGMQLVGLACIAAAPRRPRTARSERVRTAWRPVLSASVLPGAIAASAWAGESIMMSFLIPHLEDRGLAPSGLLSAASIFTVFAISVVGFRLLLGSLVDRFPPHLVSIVSLVATAAGYAVLAWADNFGVAALGAAILGCGFSPLYPALLLLVTRRLEPTNRAAGLGVFTSGVDVGMAGGVLAGGILIDLSGGSTALLGAAGFQLVAIALLLSRRWATAGSDFGADLSPHRSDPRVGAGRTQ
ncbi:MFS transporter [Prescottella equi]|uniref:MFS transporter n=1 Tax=Rhodococcus hoagii TaxID=43767 RepID=UPI002740BB7D|nr:MFS transporter [Prescottella equi]MDP8015175.1 MFS transporter [Prescottella equi]